jgi:hypothetical protein
MGTDFAVITGLALVFLLLSWAYSRAVGGGRPLNRFKRALLWNAFTFVLGMGYLMVLVADVHWPKGLLFPLIAGWGIAVAFWAWHRRRSKRAES